MTKVTSTIMMYCGIFAVSVGCQKSQSQTLDGLSVDRTSHHFKPTDRVLETTFKLRNTSNAALEITQVTSTCGCTIADLQSKKLSPGDGTTLKVSMNRPSVGTIESAITIETNLAMKRPLTLRLTAEAVTNQSRIVSVLPILLRLDTERCPEGELRTISIEEKSAATPQLQASCDIEGTTLELMDKKSLPLGDKGFEQVERKYRIRLPSDMNRGTQLGTIHFNFGSATIQSSTHRSIPLEIVGR